jgi:hypothetical protein
MRKIISALFIVALFEGLLISSALSDGYDNCNNAYRACYKPCKGTKNAGACVDDCRTEKYSCSRAHRESIEARVMAKRAENRAKIKDRTQR